MFWCLVADVTSSCRPNQPTNDGHSTAHRGREQQILAGLPQVHAVARRISMRVPRSVALDDGFSSYAQHRIHGAILDFLRGEDPLSRGERQRVRQSDPDHQQITVSLDEIPADCLNCMSVESHANSSFIRVLLNGGRRCLPAREQRILDLISCLGLVQPRLCCPTRR